MRSVLGGLALAAALANPPRAQEVEPGRWTFGTAEFRGAVAWVAARAEGEGSWRLTAACGATGLRLHLAPPVAPKPDTTADTTAVLTLAIGGETFAAPATAETLPGGDREWAADLTEDLVRALSAGFTVKVFAPEGVVSIGLTGSSRSLKALKAACDTAAATAAEALPPVDPDRAEAALRDRIAAACAPEAPTLAEGAILARDVTGDGRADHVIDWAQVTCGPAKSPAPDTCMDGMCAADIYVSPALPPDPASDRIDHAGLTLWPDRAVAIRTQSPDYTKPLDWRWGGSEFLASIPFKP